MKTKSKFREWLEDAVLGFYFWLTGMTEQEYWERANLFRPTTGAGDLALPVANDVYHLEWIDADTVRLTKPPSA